MIAHSSAVSIRRYAGIWVWATARILSRLGYYMTTIVMIRIDSAHLVCREIGWILEVD